MRHVPLVNSKTALSDIYYSTLAPPSLFDNARSLAGRLSTLFSQRWPGSTVELFGSCASGIAGPDSDVDLVAHGHAELARGDPAAIVKVHDFLEQRVLGLVGFREVLNARVPILKFTARIGPRHPRRHDVNVDLSLGQPVKVYNSLLVKAYAGQSTDRLHPTTKVLLCLVQRWAKARGVSTVFIEHTPSPYAHALLVITFLQTVVGVANLQPRYLVPNFVDGIDVACAADLKRFVPVRFRDPEYLLRSYFQWLSHQLDPFGNGLGVSAVVSPRLGTVTHKSSTDSEPWRLSIEDPLEHFESLRPRDLGDVLNQTGQIKFFSEVQRAYQILSVPKSHQTLSQSILALFAPVAASTAPPLPLVQQPELRRPVAKEPSRRVLERRRLRGETRPGAANPPLPVVNAIDLRSRTRWKPSHDLRGSGRRASPRGACPPVPVAAAPTPPDAPEDAGAFGLEGLSLGAASDAPL